MFKKLLYLCNYPPSDLGGACIIMKQVFSHYDPDLLTIICDAEWLDSAKRKCPESLIACRHESVPNRLPIDLRPRTYVSKIRSILNLGRVDEIYEIGKTLVQEENIEAIMLPLYYAEFAIAGYRLHKDYGLPFYIWESDDWEAIHSSLPIVRRSVNKLHPHLLLEARCAWMVSYNMIADYRQKYGAEGKLLFNYADLDQLDTIDPSPKLDRQQEFLHITYTGALNQMFASSMNQLCAWINQGLVIGGRMVKLTIYTTVDPSEYIGLHVQAGGYVTHSQISSILAASDILLIAVAFSEAPEVMRMVRTCLYTKTIDYLASRRPILYFGPPIAAEYAYFRGVMKCVTSNSYDAFVSALNDLIHADEANQLAQRGFDFVVQNHGPQALKRNVLDHFLD